MTASGGQLFVIAPRIDFRKSRAVARLSRGTGVARHSLSERSGPGRGNEFLLRCLAMNKMEMQGGMSLGPPAPAEVVEREAGLRRNLTPGQLAMIGLRSSIGTGLFLGSAIFVKLAGPAVILSSPGGGIVRTLRGDVLESVGGVCDSPHLLVLHDGGGGQRSRGRVDLLQVLVPGNPVVDFDRLVLACDPLRQLHQHRKSWNI